MSQEVNQTTYSLAELDQEQALMSILETSVSLNFPIAIWRLPLTDEIKLIVDLSGRSKKVKVDFEVLPSGFTIAPFHSNKNDSADFISADLTYSSNDREIRVSPVFNDSHTTELFFQGLKFHHKKGAKANYHLDGSSPGNNQFSKESYKGLVERCVDHIKNTNLKKIVLSRVKSIDLSPKFDPIKIFLQLTKAYPGAFINLVSLPGKGTWMGATPELLVSQDEKDIFKTVSLAGTQKAEPGSDPLEIGWTQKEIEEQALVGRYIINCFKKIRLREFEEEGPKTVKAANLYHLKSEYLVNTREVNFPQLATVMLDLLHPTSAVCGMPKEESMAYILENEGYHREFYAGYLGPVNINQQSHLFVNLRCMQLFENQALLYAGGGITEFSDSEKEWMETEMKCNTLLNIINQSIAD